MAHLSTPPMRRRAFTRACAATGVAASLAFAAQAAALSGDDTIRTLAGNGTAASSGDGGPARAAAVNQPIGITATPDGSVYIPESEGHRIRRVAPDGTISTVAGTGVAGFGGDGGPAAAATLNAPVDTAIDTRGNLYIAERDNNRVRVIRPDGTISTVAGSGPAGFEGDGGPATAARLNNPVGVTVDAAGNLYIADALNRRIRRVDPSGIITTVVGTGAEGATGDGGPATGATLVRPDDVRIDSFGNLLVVDSKAHRIRRVDTSGIITTIAGTGVPGSIGDGGPATSARLSAPNEVAADAFGNLYISDTSNHRVRRVNAAGVISTIAGNGTPGFAGDGGPAVRAQLSSPSGAALTQAGDLLIADAGNNRVRRIDNPVGASAIPEGTAQCGRIPDRPTRAARPGRVELSAGQLLINQRISQAAVRRVNAVQAKLDAGLESTDLCGGAFLAASFGPGITTAADSTPRPEAARAPRPKALSIAAGSRGRASAVQLEAGQLLISQRISQAAVRRANALTKRLDAGLTGGDVKAGAVTAAKIAVGLRIAGAAAGGPEPAPTRTAVAPAPRRPSVRVTLSARQILINQRIAQAAVRRSNALVDRLGAGFSARDFRPGTITARNLAPELRGG